MHKFKGCDNLEMHTIFFVLRQEMLAALPPVVQKWLKRASIVGKPIIYTVCLFYRFFYWGKRTINLSSLIKR